MAESLGFQVFWPLYTVQSFTALQLTVLGYLSKNKIDGSLVPAGPLGFSVVSLMDNTVLAVFGLSLYLPLNAH